MGPELILLLVTLTLWAGGFLLAARVKPCVQASPAAADAVSIVIPARNEERNLPALLRSLQAQRIRPGEILVVDDGSTDRTAAVARELGATVLASKPLPDGWRGKTWACHQGAQMATGRWLLFLDADTWFEAGGLERVLGAYPGGAFSVGPYHAVRRPYEDLSLLFNLNMTFGTIPDGLFGQMLLVDRASYLRAGGHEAVRDRVLENFSLAARFRAAGVAVRSVTGRGVLSFRMYPVGLRELVEGWTKGFASGAVRTPGPRLALIVAWMTGLTLAPVGLLLTDHALPWVAAYALCAVQMAWLARRVGSFSALSAVLYPVPVLFFFGIFAWSMARSGRRVVWKGREIRAD